MTRLTILSIGAMLALAACQSSAGTGSPPGSQPDGSTAPSLAPSAAPAIGSEELVGRILFGRMGREFGDATIFTANADGSGDTKVGGYLSDKTTCCPRWSPDGGHIAFVAQNDHDRFTTAIVRPDGSDIVLFELPGSFEGACQVWSRGTDRMACEAGYRDDPSSGGIYTVRAGDGSDPQPVVVDKGMALPMDFSPDGSQIVFIGDPIGPPTGVDPGAPVGSLYVVNVDGSGLHRITPDGVYALFSSRWSPDGEWIVFGGLGRTGDPIWVVRPDGSDLHELYADASRGAVHPTWSPDGEFVLFALDPPDTMATFSESPPNEVCVIRADGTDLTCNLDTNDHKIWFDWAS